MDFSRELDSLKQKCPDANEELLKAADKMSALILDQIRKTAKETVQGQKIRYVHWIDCFPFLDRQFSIERKEMAFRPRIDKITACPRTGEMRLFRDRLVERLQGTGVELSGYLLYSGPNKLRSYDVFWNDKEIAIYNDPMTRQGALSLDGYQSFEFWDKWTSPHTSWLIQNGQKIDDVLRFPSLILIVRYLEQ